MRRFFLLLLTHGAAVLVGFALGIYALPLLIAPPAPTAEEVAQALRESVAVPAPAAPPAAASPEPVASALSAGASDAAMGAASDAAAVVTAASAPPPAPAAASWTGRFRRDLKGSDALHWGEGEVTVTRRHVALIGSLAPGPDYKLYLSPAFVETEAEFEQLKSSMRRVGDVKTFRNFLVELPADVDVTQFTTVVVWCETFRQFISAATYR